MALKQYSFTIEGNNDNPAGNPIPKLRMTQNTLWTPQARRYGRWKVYVQEQFWRQIEGKTKFGKPFRSESAVMSLRIRWKDKTHGDPESIFGSIADALWENDKFLAGSFDYEYSAEKKGSVEVTITIKETDEITTGNNSGGGARRGKSYDPARINSGAILSA